LKHKIIGCEMLNDVGNIILTMKTQNNWL